MPACPFVLPSHWASFGVGTVDSFFTLGCGRGGDLHGVSFLVVTLHTYSGMAGSAPGMVPYDVGYAVMVVLPPHAVLCTVLSLRSYLVVVAMARGGRW